MIKIEQRVKKNSENNSFQSQIEFYNSSDISYHCIENKIVSQLLGIDLSCLYSLSCGAQFPECQNAQFILMNYLIAL